VDWRCCYSCTWRSSGNLFRSVTARTRASAPTIDYMRGTASPSTGAGTLGRRLPDQRYSTNDRTHRTTDLPCGATSRRAGSGCVGVLKHWASCLPQARGLEQWWEHQSLHSSFCLTEFSFLQQSCSDSSRSPASFPRRPAYLIAMPRSAYSSSW
jgi:hypothetical protein